MINRTLKILDQLISIDTTTTHDTMEAVNFVQTVLHNSGVDTRIIMSENGARASIVATIGNPSTPGIIFSGHLDTVAAEKDEWSVPPHKLTLSGSRAYGRGTTDMKGAIAVLLAHVDILKSSGRTFHIALTHDEESKVHAIGRVLDAGFGHPPAGCIVMEPTGLSTVVAHKGVYLCRICVTGKTAHSAQPELGVDASEYIVKIYEKLQSEFKNRSAGYARDTGFSPDRSTMNIGTLNAGDAVNKIPGTAELTCALRYIPDDDIRGFNESIMQFCYELDHKIKDKDKSCGIVLKTEINIESFSANTESDFIKMFPGNHTKASFGTEAGFFEKRGINTVVFGPGNISQAHIKDEFIEILELEKFGKWITEFCTRT
ncbi:MAG: M20/M25/M40 family metallo-hydrolase [Alphaproteobacteria bacterium]|nr:M20/M25/M40 family metallo-hydrolase [Alphaproteobacteria bacterium]